MRSGIQQSLMRARGKSSKLRANHVTSVLRNRHRPRARNIRRRRNPLSRERISRRHGNAGQRNTPRLDHTVKRSAGSRAPIRRCGRGGGCRSRLYRARQRRSRLNRSSRRCGRNLLAHSPNWIHRSDADRNNWRHEPRQPSDRSVSHSAVRAPLRKCSLHSNCTPVGCLHSSDVCARDKVYARSAHRPCPNRPRANHTRITRKFG